jgi:hypothetical protein
MKKSVYVVLAVAASFVLVTPSFARGFGGGGGFGGGRSFGGGFGGGDRSFGGYGGDRGFSGGDRDFGGADRGFGGDRGFDGDRGGDTAFSGDRGAGVDSGFMDRGFGGDSGVHNYSWGGAGGGVRTPTEGGFGHISGIQNRTPTNINSANLSNQGKSIRNSFNGDTVNVTKNNTFNQVGGYHGGYGYHGGAYGYGGYGYHGYGYHGYGWGYPGGWYVPGWSEATAWTCMGLASLDTFLGLAALGGGGGGGSDDGNSSSNVTYNNENVYVNGQPAGTQAAYYQQAQQLAQTGITQANLAQAQPQTNAMSPQNWQPLGVFALAEPGQTSSNMLMQLAINKDGIVEGNYYNQLTNESSQVYGSLDKKTKRISWTIGTNANTVFDASLGDLTKDDSSVLVHYGPTNTQRMALIRLQQPAQGATKTT